MARNFPQGDVATTGVVRLAVPPDESINTAMGHPTVSLGFSQRLPGYTMPSNRGRGGTTCRVRQEGSRHPCRRRQSATSLALVHGPGLRQPSGRGERSSETRTRLGFTPPRPARDRVTTSPTSSPSPPRALVHIRSLGSVAGALPKLGAGSLNRAEPRPAFRRKPWCHRTRVAYPIRERLSISCALEWVLVTPVWRRKALPSPQSKIRDQTSSPTTPSLNWTSPPKFIRDSSEHNLHETSSD